MGMARELVVEWKFVRLLLSHSVACFTSDYSSHCFSVSVYRTAGLHGLVSFGRSSLVLVFLIILCLWLRNILFLLLCLCILIVMYALFCIFFFFILPTDTLRLP